ncbi:hypothetical protein FA15DRAFT_661888 [Coprinopsis marcescibilis]|uniref:Uncharacterized protein n=1 Tax=Coprinopsis marcescibilis TaxID=230819 RepID=A0A5C3KAS2_COPMA|nr:hypothetical protein FA15DRAFT_661888 [Coprinopsis marcescibilis]
MSSKRLQLKQVGTVFLHGLEGGLRQDEGRSRILCWTIHFLSLSCKRWLRREGPLGHFPMHLLIGVFGGCDAAVVAAAVSMVFWSGLGKLDMSPHWPNFPDMGCRLDLQRDQSSGHEHALKIDGIGKEGSNPHSKNQIEKKCTIIADPKANLPHSNTSPSTQKKTGHQKAQIHQATFD